ncbi:hypothetical protein Tco_0586847 [Tanacetum coccineum]
MAELLRAPTEGNAEAIVVPPIPAEHCELKHSLLNLVTSKQYFGFEKEDPHAHIRWFNKITSTMKYKDVPDSAIKLMLFPFSIDGPARIWLEKEPPRSITTWDDLVSKFNQQILSTSKNKKKLSNEISNFHNALLLKNITPPLASVIAVEESCVTCGGPHPYYQCPATNGNAFPGYQDNIQAYVSACRSTSLPVETLDHVPPSIAQFQVRPPGFHQVTEAITNPKWVSFEGPPIHPPFSHSPTVVEREALRLNNQKLRERDDHQMMKFLQIFRSLHFNLSFSDALLYMAKFASTFKNLLSNKKKLFEVAILLEIAQCLALADLGASINLMPLSIWKKLSLPELTPTQMILELAGPVILNHRHCRRCLVKKLTLRVGDEAITFKVGNTSKFSYNDAESINRIDVIDVACEEYSQEVLGFFGNSESGNPTPISEPIISKSSPSFTPFEGGDFILEEIENDSDSDFFLESPKTFPSELETFRFDIKEKNSGSTTDHAVVSLPEYERFYSEGDIRLLEKFLNNDPSPPLLPKEIKAAELKK